MMSYKVPSIRSLALASLFAFGLLCNPSQAIAQEGTTGPVVLTNRSGDTITVSNLRYTGADRVQRTLTGRWELKPGFNGYLMVNNRKIVANRIEYDVSTADGKTVNWSASCRQLDKDGDFCSSFSAENIATHRRLLGKAPAARKPAGPSDEDLKRAVVKALGAVALHVAANREPEDLGEAFAIGLARKGRDELIASAIEDAFPSLTADEARAVRVLAISALDGNLTERGLRAAESQARVQEYLRRNHPEMAAATEVAQFLVAIDQNRKK